MFKTRSRLLKCLVCSCFLCACLFNVTAQAQFRFDHWSADNGLPQNSVREIIQTRDGYLWLTTLDGLVRFDGVHFTVFNKSNTPGLVSNRFNTLFEDGQGDLWITTEGRGLVRLHQGRFTTYTTQDGMPPGQIYSVGNDGYGELVFFPAAHCFRWWNGQFVAADDLNLPWQPQALTTRYQAQRAAFWSDNFTTLDAVSNGRFYKFKQSDFPPGFQVASGTTDHEGVLWFGSFAHGLFGFEQGRLTKRLTTADGLPANHARLIYGPQPLQAFCIREDGSYWLFDLTTRQSELLTRTPPDKAFLCYADREGNYWFISYNDGLYRYQRQSITTLNQAQGLKTDEIYPLLEDRQGAVWIGTALDGLYRWQQGELQHFDPIKHGAPRSLTSLYEDRAGRIWVNGAFRWEGERFERVYDEIIGQVWTMFEDDNGAFWRGTAQGVDRFYHGVKTHFTTADGLAGNETKVILDDGNGGLWLGSYGGLTHFKDGKFTKWTEADGLPGSTVRMLRRDADGALWIGTYDSGLARFKDGQFTRYTMKDGLFDNGVFQMLEDEQGWCWMSCNRGLYRVRKQEFNDFADGKLKRVNAIPYGKSDGLSNVECNGGRWPAGIKTRDGKLWFPTMGGVAIVNPSSVANNQQPPPVHLEGMRIDYRPVDAPTWYAALHEAQRAIDIQPGQENFEIDYTALSFINSEQLKFRYKLAGLDQEWVEAGTRRTANFSHVPPGGYTFTVIAANRDGVWNTTGQSVRINVRPKFYRTWWFLALSGLSVAGLLWAGYEYRVRQLKRERALQQEFSRQLMESQELERKRIAAELHDSLGQSLAIIKNRAQLSLNAPDNHDRALAQLREIAEASSEVIEEVKEIAHNLRPYQLDRLGLTKTIEGMARKVAETHDLQLELQVDRLDGLLAPGDEINLFRIVQESLNNIVKHARATEARVTIQRLPHGIELRIADNGQGFTPGATQFVEGKRQGFGLVGLAERVRQLDGSYKITSAPGQGTTLELSIGLRPQAAEQTHES